MSDRSSVSSRFLRIVSIYILTAVPALAFGNDIAALPSMPACDQAALSQDAHGRDTQATTDGDSALRFTDGLSSEYFPIKVAAADTATMSSPVDPLCGSSEVISCSVYAKFRGVRDPIRKGYSDKFHSACAQHDWCYRYGYATYGRSKYNCDQRFLVQAKEICGQFSWGSVLLPGLSQSGCVAAADTFYGVLRLAPDAEKAYQEGKTKCAYDGFCPPGKFETTGSLHGCRCPTGHKVYTGIARETAYCTGSVACPPGRFSTTGALRGCYCPEGKPKDYEVTTGNAYAKCKGFDALCPSGEFGTTGKWRGCDCPEGTRKNYIGITKAKAKCVKTGGGGGGGGTDRVIRQN